MIKLFVSDMDGTLLNNYLMISSKNAEAILSLQEHDIEFIVATGRTLKTAVPMLEDHGIKSHMINLNGAATYDPEGNLLDTIPLPSESVIKMIEYLRSENLYYLLLTENHYYVQNKLVYTAAMNSYVQKFQQQNPELMNRHSIKKMIQVIDQVQEFPQELDQPTEPSLKILVQSSQTKKLEDFKKTFQADPELDITSSAPDNLEITHNLAQKGLAIQKYIADKGYTLDQVATIGDSLNDRSMLSMAKYSFAMDNASNDIKALARYTVPSNDKDGVAVAINQIIQNRLHK